MSIQAKNISNNFATCPACGLLCDDINILQASPIKISNLCNKSVTFFQQADVEPKPTVYGKPVTIDVAIETAAAILNNSQQPLFSGLGTEVQGMRSVMRLAEKTNATLDHMHSEATVNNTLAMQNSGWNTTTLTEIKNRADLILAIGTDIISTHPRFLDKLVFNKESLFNKAKPEVIYLAQNNVADLPEIMNAMNALANGKKLSIGSISGVSIDSLNKILDKLKTANYAVIVWSASKLDFSHAELTVQSITRLIAKLNETTRVAGLPLNSGDGDTSINNTSAWLSGFATRSRYRDGSSEYDSHLLSATKQLQYCDALLWISTFNAISPPTTQSPCIIIGHPNTQFIKAPDVFIPVSIPGLDHAGTMFRMDSAVVLPLKKVRESSHLTLSQVLQKIEAKLT